MEFTIATCAVPSSQPSARGKTWNIVYVGNIPQDPMCN